MQDVKPECILRLKRIRESLGKTVEAFSEALSYPNYADIEDSKSDLPGDLVVKLLQVYSINPLWLYAESPSRYLDISMNTAPKYIVLGETEEELVLLVNEKASAGYPQNILDRDWYKELPSMKLPFPNYKNASHRGFQVHGDSMLPNIYPGDWVIGRSVPSIQEVSSGKIYIVVLPDAVVVKQVYIEDKSSSSILLRSTNPEYEDLSIKISEIQELWEVSSKLSFAVNVSEDNSLRQELHASMRDFIKD